MLRAKIDMKHKNVIMRDPIMYRILKKEHPRTGQLAYRLRLEGILPTFWLL